MSEKYPKRWRDACLKLLQFERDKICAELGYKRVGWAPIRNRIMKPFDKYENGKLFKEDERLVRQNLDSWEKGAELSDEKFNFIDAYIRKQAIENRHKQAVEALQAERFFRQATVFSEMMIASKHKYEYAWDLSHTPWLAMCNFEKGHAYKSSFIYGLSTFEGIVRVIAGFISNYYEDLSDLKIKDVIFYEGYLIPLREFSEVTEYNSSIYYSKMLNPMWVGHSTFCFLEGQISFYQANGELDAVRQEGYLDAFDPPLLKDGPPSDLIQNSDGLYGYDKYKCLSYINYARPTDVGRNSYVYINDEYIVSKVKCFIDTYYTGYVI
jgi:hypothetical protein